MTTTITIEDYPCGSGKTTNMIKSFKQEEKYLVILSYLSEVDRIIEDTTDVCFVEPIAETQFHLLLSFFFDKKIVIFVYRSRHSHLLQKEGSNHFF